MDVLKKIRQLGQEAGDGHIRGEHRYWVRLAVVALFASAPGTGPAKTMGLTNVDGDQLLPPNDDAYIGTCPDMSTSRARGAWRTLGWDIVDNDLPLQGMTCPFMTRFLSS